MPHNKVHKALDEIGTQELIDEIKRRTNAAQIPHYTTAEFEALSSNEKPRSGEYFVITDD